MHFAGFLTEFFWRPEAVSRPSPVQSPIAPSRALTHKTIRKPCRLEPHWQAAKAKSGRTWLLQVAKVATVLIAINTRLGRREQSQGCGWDGNGGGAAEQ